MLSQKTPVKHDLLYLNIFLYSFVIYAIGAIMSSSSIINPKIPQALQALSVVSMIGSGIFLGKLKFDSAYLRLFFILYFIWMMRIIAKGFSLNYDFMKDFLFGSNNGGLIYFAPLIVLFPRKLIYYKKLFNIIIVFAIIYLLLSLIFIKQLLIKGDNIESQSIIENIFEISIPSMFILLTYKYHTTKKNIIAIVTIFSTVAFIVIRARRGLIFISGSLIFFCFIFYFFGTKKKILIIYLSILILCLVGIYATNLYKVANNKFIGFLYSRGNEDTRTTVELLFYDDLKPNDWVVGKGITGKYFCPDIEENQVSNYRTVIETGYLQLILKGGIINLALLLLITIPALIKGIFFSNNILSKAAGIWIFQFLIDLYPQNSVSFNFYYIIVWISVGICYSDIVRRMSNHEIEAMLLS